MNATSASQFLEYYRKIRQRTNNLISVIPPEKMNWAYMPGKFSIGDQLRHIALIERNLFVEILLGRRNNYTGCDKSFADGYEHVIDLFNNLHKESIELMGNISEDDFEGNCMTPGNVRIAKIKWLGLLVEHEIHHRAQLYIYLNMLGIKTPPMYGISSEELVMVGG